MQHVRLKRFAKSCLATVRPKFSDRKKNARLDDPERIGAIFPLKEWDCESPLKEFFPIQDWILFHGSSPDSQTRLIVFFERRSHNLAVFWIVLEVRGSTLYSKEEYHADYSKANTFCAGGLRLVVDAPLRRWSLAFNGVMVDRTRLQEVHVKIAARFASFSKPFEFPRDIGPSKFARRYEAPGKTFRRIREDMRGASLFAGYEQAGTFYSDIRVNGNHLEDVLFGAKLRYIGASRTNSCNHLSLFHQANHHFGYATNGAVFHIIDLPKGRCYGFCYTPSVKMRRISKGRLAWRATRVLSSFKSGPFSFQGSWSTAQSLAIAPSTAPANTTWRVSVSWGSLRIKNNDFNCGVLSLKLPDEQITPEGEVSKFESLRQDPSAPGTGSVVVGIDEEECRYAYLTGGKGSSLAALLSLSEQLETFIVPKAVVVTTRAYEQFASLEEVSETLDELAEAVANLSWDTAHLKSVSEECVNRLTQIVLPNELSDSIKEKFLETIGPLNENRSVAVRSSAVGEDSEEMSAAGQMATFLNLRDFNDVLEAVVKCWASQFSLTALNYKRQYGQKLRGSGMAVVIQEMVNPDAAGVMFTCDPISGHPGRITITANYGLGESVVSAQVDPDTFVLNRSKGHGGLPRFDIDSKILGGKEECVVVSPSGGTLNALLNEMKSTKFCLSDELVKAVARVGSQVEDHFDVPRDIEWAVKDERIFLLQCRPITSIFTETEYELRHDLSTGIPTKREALSRANLDEVMPGCLSPMTLDFMAMNFDVFLLRIIRKHFPDLMDYSLYTPKFFHHIGKKAYLNASSNLFGLGVKQLKEQVLTTIGTDIDDHEVFKKGIFHESLASQTSRMKMARLMWNISNDTEENLRKGRLVAENFSINLPSCATSAEMAISFAKQLHKMKNSFGYLAGATASASNWTKLTIKILKGILGKRAPTGEVMSLFSKLVRSDLEVESADIPENLRNLAMRIKSSTMSDAFNAVSAEEALEMLRTDESETGQHFRDFLKKHGHRCYKEFDFTSKPWSMDPLQLVKVLKSYTQTDVPKSEPDSINIRPGFVNKKLLEYTVPRARKAIYAREALKSAAVKCIHELRKALLLIGARMREEDRIPREELIFFLTLDEMHRLTVQHDPNLVSKARRRERLHPKINREKFPVIICGIPEPLKTMRTLVGANNTLFHGMTVSEGSVTGVARVVHDFEREAHLIQNGDILITHCTDTGWTPYFPMLSGVVTEIGGTISHGAVVAREFGLPALVGVVGATEAFRSGDIVVIDGNAGTVSKLKPSRPSSEKQMEAATDQPWLKIHEPRYFNDGTIADDICCPEDEPGIVRAQEPSSSAGNIGVDVHDPEVVPSVVGAQNPSNSAMPDEISTSESQPNIPKLEVTPAEEAELFVSAEDLLNSDRETISEGVESSGENVIQGGASGERSEVQRLMMQLLSSEDEDDEPGPDETCAARNDASYSSPPADSNHHQQSQTDIPYLELESEL